MAGTSLYSLISFHSRDVLCTLSRLLFGRAFVCFVLVWLFIVWPFIRFQGVFKQSLTATATSTIAVFSSTSIGFTLFPRINKGFTRFNTLSGQLKIDYNQIFKLAITLVVFFYEQDIAKRFVHKHCFCYLNVENVKETRCFTSQWFSGWHINNNR